MSDRSYPEVRQMISTRLDILYAGTLPPPPGGSAVSAGQLLGAFRNRGHSVRALSPATEAQLIDGDPFAACEPEIEVKRCIVPASFTTAFVLRILIISESRARACVGKQRGHVR